LFYLVFAAVLSVNRTGGRHLNLVLFLGGSMADGCRPIYDRYTGVFLQISRMISEFPLCLSQICEIDTTLV